MIVQRKPPYTLALIVTLALMVFLPSAVRAKNTINTNWWGVAVKGYDTVAYFTESRPVKGKKDFEHRWQGARWRFASQAHLDLFKADPEKYAPRYGGY